MNTHEAFIHAVAEAAIARLSEEDRKAFDGFKLTYGAGMGGIRGITYYNRWKKGEEHPAAPFVEISAFCQESHIQLAGTTIHELAHVLAGFGAGHDKQWKEACAKLGLRRCLAAGTIYRMANFAPDIRFLIAGLPKPVDGEPVCALTGPAGRVAPKPCGAGIGTRGGKSRGKGSGSRMRLFHCDCEPPVKVRAAREELDATCNCCSGLFHRV